MGEKQDLTWKDFPSATYDSWYGETVKLLKGADFNKKLIKTTYDGIKISPLYYRDGEDNCAGRPIRFYRERFKKVQEFNANSSDEGINDINAALGNGVDEISLSSIDLVKDTLNRFDLKKHRLSFQSGVMNEKNLNHLKVTLEQKGLSARALKGNLGFDPLDEAFQKNESPETGMKELKTIFPLIIDQFSEMTPLNISGHSFYNHGASDTLEMATSLSKGIFYIKNLLETGISLENIFKRMSFSFALSPELFLSISKLRAFRLNMQQVYESFGGKGVAPIWLHAKSAERSLTQFDPWVNILRGTIVAFSGAVGGADSITVSPFDERIKVPDSLSQRVARNTGLILDEESHLGFVDDPLAGSYAIENLTYEMAKKSWELMQKIEAEGGIINYVSSGKMKEDINAINEQRNLNVAKRRNPITGVSEFPFLNEDLSTQMESLKSDLNFPPLHNAEQYEALRRKSNSFLKTHGVRPTVVMATLGPIAKHVARSTFTQNFFAAGGLNTIQVEGNLTVEELSKFFKDNKTATACLSAPDDLYLEKGGELMERLRKAGARYIVLAGRLTDELKFLEVDGSLSLGCDVIEVLNNVWGQF